MNPVLGSAARVSPTSNVLNVGAKEKRQQKGFKPLPGVRLAPLCPVQKLGRWVQRSRLCPAQGCRGCRRLSRDEIRLESWRSRSCARLHLTA